MSDLIRRNDAIVALAQSADYIADALERLEKVPAVDAEPVVHSFWHWTPDGYVYCENCTYPLAKTRVTIEGVEHHLYLTTNYCAHCGAKMDAQAQQPKPNGYVLSTKICPFCGKQLMFNPSIVLTSCPPKRELKCTCGYREYETIGTGCAPYSVTLTSEGNGE